VNLRQTSTTFTVANGTAPTDLLVSAPIVQGIASAGITKAGPGTMRVTATSTYTGATEVQEGTLLVGGSVSGSQFNVAAGATLGGAGIVGPVSVFDGGVIAPGDGVGTLSVSSLFLSGASALKFELAVAGVAGGAGNDLLQIGGELTLDGTLQVLPQAGFTAGRYPLMTYGGSLLNNTLSLDPSFLATYPGSFIDTATAGTVSLVVVPEPSAALLLLGGITPLLARRRRRS
jgi:fibronectin-binding autotransporter adhesin